MTATEARAKLESYVVILKARLKGVLKGPWYLDPDDPEGCGPICSPEHDGWDEDEDGHETSIVARGPELYCGKDGYPTSKFIAFSRSAVPALLAGIEAVLKHFNDTVAEDFLLMRDDDASDLEKGLAEAGALETCIGLIVFAESMKPYFKEDTNE